MRPNEDADAAQAVDPHRNDLELLKDAVRYAAPIALERFRLGGSAKADNWRKSDGSVVTEVDLAVNAALREVVVGGRPDNGWLSEEDAPDPDRLMKERVVIVDPIDGTRSFVEGRPEFCLSIAIAERGGVIAGVVFAPALDQLFEATRDGPALLNGEPIAASTRTDLVGARVLSSKSQFKPARWPGGPPPVTLGYVQPIAYRLCLTASGVWDALVSLKGTNEWDVAAGALIAERAGAVVTDSLGRAFTFNTPSARIEGALIASPTLHRALHARLSRQPYVKDAAN